jgi:hypothetical protein
MAATMARQEYNRLAVEFAKAEFVRGAAERALDTPPFDIGEAVDAVKSAAADNADDPARHFGLAFHHRDTEITEFVRSLLCALPDSLVNYQWIRDQILRFAA